MAISEITPVRTEERIIIKIGEAKNLISRAHGTLTQRDIYCTISLDQEHIFRTSTIEKTLNPFFGEEFQFEIPRKFRFLSIYVYDRERPSNRQDRLLGKVAIKREELHIFHNKDHWFPIRPITLDSEVQGTLHVKVSFERNSPDTASERLHINVLEATDLTLVNGNCDTFVEVVVRYTNGKQDTHRTRVKKKTNSPVFGELFTFTLPKNDLTGDKQRRFCPADDTDWLEAVMTVYHEVSGNNLVFVGEIKLSLLGPQQQTHAASEAWYYLQPRKKRTSIRMPASSLSSAAMDENCLGTLRLRIQYFVDHILPAHYYKKFKDIILRSPNVQPVTSSAAYLLGEIIPSKVEVAHCLVRIFVHGNQIVPLMRALAVWEISKVTDVNTIFRGNTLVSKLMDEVMKLIGVRYLHETLKPLIEKIFNEHKPCEIDPCRVKDLNVIQQNLSNLKVYTEEIFKAITSSALYCPSLMCQLFHDLKEIAILFFPENKEIRYSVISGFIFLRFFAPAILGPRLFDLTTRQIDIQTNRTLTLISKMIQSLGNLVSSRTVPCKEEYMSCMYQAFYNDAHTTVVRQFLEIISASATPAQNINDKPVVLKEGPLIKRAQGRKRFGRKTFAQRYFKLTTNSLSYSKHKGKETLYEIPLMHIQAVERLNRDTFKRNNMFQIVQAERILYLQASNCVEEKEWLDPLSKMCSSNADRLSRYHPAAYVKGSWTCCKSNDKRCSGCSCVSDVNEGIYENSSIDIDRELSALHTLTFTHIERLENVLRACECQAAFPKEMYFLPASVIEDVKSCSVTLSSLRDIIYDLEQEQRSVLRRIARETKYGSRHAPIGDDNYLLFAGRLEAITRRNLF